MFDFNSPEETKESLDTIFPEEVIEPEAKEAETSAEPEPVAEAPEVVENVELQPVAVEAPVESQPDPDNDYTDLGTDSNGLVPIYVSSEGLDTKARDGQKFVYGFTNGEYWEFQADQQAMVKPQVFEIANAINESRKNPVGFKASLNNLPGA